MTTNDSKADIELSLINNSFIRVHTENGIKAELREYFAFFADGYKFMPLYKNKMWDGKVRLYNALDSTLPAGLYGRIRKFASDRGYSMAVRETSFGVPKQTQVFDPKVLESMVIPWVPKDYQQRALEIAIQDKRRVIESPTGSGKSLIIYMIIRYYLALQEKRLLVIVPTTSLVEQMYSDFVEYAGPEPGVDFEKYMHKIYSGQDKKTDKPVVITTWQSIQRTPKEWFDKFGCVIGDECHGFKAKSLTTIMNKCENADYRIGTTGTIGDKKVNRLVLEGLFGPVHKTTTTKALQKEGTLAALDIEAIVLEYTNEEVKLVSGGSKQMAYQPEIQFIIAHEKRNKFIRDLALAQKGNTLITFNFVEKHGEILQRLIREKSKNSVYYIHGDTKTTEREQVRAIVENEKNAIIVASSGTFSTGINIRNLHNIIFASPTKSQIRVIQSIGRGLRKSDNGETTKLFDIIDDLSKGSKKNFAMKHAQERLKMYKSEEFPVKIIDINLGELYE